MLTLKNLQIHTIVNTYEYNWQFEQGIYHLTGDKKNIQNLFKTINGQGNYNGEIIYMGQANLSKQQIRSCYLSYVSSDLSLISTISIKKNIQLFKECINQDQLEQYLQLFQIDINCKKALYKLGYNQQKIIQFIITVCLNKPILLVENIDIWLNEPQMEIIKEILGNYNGIVIYSGDNIDFANQQQLDVNSLWSEQLDSDITGDESFSQKHIFTPKGFNNLSIFGILTIILLIFSGFIFIHAASRFDFTMVITVLLPIQVKMRVIFISLLYFIVFPPLLIAHLNEVKTNDVNCLVAFGASTIEVKKYIFRSWLPMIVATIITIGLTICINSLIFQMISIKFVIDTIIISTIGICFQGLIIKLFVKHFYS